MLKSIKDTYDFPQVTDDWLVIVLVVKFFPSLIGVPNFFTYTTVVVIEFKYDENTREILCFLHTNYDMKNP